MRVGQVRWASVTCNPPSWVSVHPLIIASYMHFLCNEALNELDSIFQLVVVDLQLRFTEHIASITRKSLQRANLIHQCFMAKDCSLLIKAFINYVRPVLRIQ